MRTPKHLSQGFTLLELMLVISIIGILAGLSLGYSGTFLRDEGLKEFARAWVDCLAQARAQAMRQSTQMTVTFQNGVIYAYQDVNKNGGWDIGETVIMQYPQALGTQVDASYALSSPSASTSSSFGPTARLDYQGYSVDGSNLPAAPLFCFRCGAINRTRVVQLSVAGIARTMMDAWARAQCP